MNILKNKYKDVFDLSPYGMALIDKNANFIIINNEFCNIVGYTEQELLKIKFLDITHPKDVDNDKKYMSQLINKQVDNIRIKKQYIHKSGILVDIFVGVRASFDSNGKFQYFVVVFQDINNDISLIRDDILLDANNKLSETNRELSDFAYIASHDLKAPIRGISNYINLIFDRIDCDCVKHDQKIIKYKEKIDNSINNMNLLISDLLTFATIGKDKLTKKKINIHSYFNDLSKHMFKEVNSINISGDAEVVVEEIFMQQLFVNLVSNSIKYSKPDIESDISVKIYEIDDIVNIEFSDNGIGINEKYHEEIFKPFKRLHSHDEYEGSGIGLFTCKKIMDKLNGNIKVKNSQIGIGTTIILSWRKIC